SLFSRAKDEDISPEEYIRYARECMRRARASLEDKAQEEEALQQIEISQAYAKYQELLIRGGLFDFGNQFYLALNLLRDHPLVLKRYQQQFKYILVDEFQDTNFSQYQLAKLLSGEKANITVTGDDDQCIYRFRGAAYSNLLNFIRDFPHTHKVSLVKNYRSSQVILDSAYRLIQHNNPDRFEVKAGIDKRLIGLSQEGKEVEYLHFDTISTESDQVASLIKEKVSRGSIKYRDCAILVRANADAEPFLQALNMLDIPWQFSGNQGLYSREEVRLCINFLRVVANLADSLSLYYLVSSEVYQLPLNELSIISSYAKRRNKPLYVVFQQVDSLKDLEGIGQGTKERIRAVLIDLEKFLRISREESTGRLLYSFLTDTGYLKELTHNPTQEKETKIQNIAQFFNIVRNFELVAQQDRVISFVNYLTLLIEAGDDPATKEADLDCDAVNILTIHKAKGLEFRVVFLVSLVQGRFPWPRRRQPIELPDGLIKEVLPQGDFHIQEERRLFYVGMTRAKEELYLTSAADYGGSRLRRISQFVAESQGREVKSAPKKKASALEAIERFAPQKESVITPSETSADGKLLLLSYYQIDDYLTCPLKYKYVNILRVPIMEHHTVIYGRAMHDAVSLYYQLKMAGKKMEFPELRSRFQRSFDPQGFLDEKHQEERFTTGCHALERFYQEEEAYSHIPRFIEKEFSFVYQKNKITGRFDRVDQTPEGAVIMDFKTSEIKTQKDADKRVSDNLQLKLYAFAYQTLFGELPHSACLYFLESGLRGQVEVLQKDIDQIKEKIQEVSSGIRKKAFGPTPEYMACTYCAYSQICPSAAGR
ncbi:MAG: ATP-dependent helicase, partial [Candidatus Omnitrophica bacterium]|nr:ATP-dependent helicase [Candidatus Omnitrophota bacterium]